MSVKQIKLVTGEEVICNVVEEDEFEVLLKDALRIQSKINEVGIRFYFFRSFMIYKEDENDLIVLRADKIVSYTTPSEDLFREYKMGLENLYGTNTEKGPNTFDLEQLDSASNIVPFKPLIH